MAEPATSPTVSPSDSIPQDSEPITSKDTPTEAAVIENDGKTNGDAVVEHVSEKEAEPAVPATSSESAVATAPEGSGTEIAEVCFSAVWHAIRFLIFLEGYADE